MREAGDDDVDLASRVAGIAEPPVTVAEVIRRIAVMLMARADRLEALVLRLKPLLAEAQKTQVEVWDGLLDQLCDAAAMAGDNPTEQVIAAMERALAGPTEIVQPEEVPPWLRPRVAVDPTGAAGVGEADTEGVGGADGDQAEAGNATAGRGEEAAAPPQRKD